MFDSCKEVMFLACCLKPIFHNHTPQHNLRCCFVTSPTFSLEFYSFDFFLVWDSRFLLIFFSVFILTFYSHFVLPSTTIHKSIIIMYREFKWKLCIETFRFDWNGFLSLYLSIWTVFSTLSAFWMNRTVYTIMYTRFAMKHFSKAITNSRAKNIMLNVQLWSRTKLAI